MERIKIKVPLICNSFIDENDDQKLEIWRDGKVKIISPPFLPYLMVRKPVKMYTEPISIEQGYAAPLSTLRSTKVWKYSYQNTKHIANINRAINAPKISSPLKLFKLFMENHTEFRERIIIDQPEYFNKFPQTQDIKILIFDIETATNNGLDLNRVLSIAYMDPNGEVHSKQLTKYIKEENGELSYHYDDDEERSLIKWFFDVIEALDPDVIAGYYMRDFDFPYLFNRAFNLGVSYSNIARNGQIEYYHDRDKVKMKIGGRILYDVLDSVMEDQSLNGIESKGLKGVAAWMQFPNIIEEDTTNTILVDPIDLKLYNESDVILTKRVLDVYWRNMVTLAEMFVVPLNMVVENSASFLANIFQGQGIHQAGIVSDGMNQDRHPDIYHRAREKGDDANYQAAYVDIYKNGRIEPVTKVDFKGMYNAIEITLNISPETTKIIGYESLENEPIFRWDIQGDKIIYYIPDDVINKCIIIRVDYTQEGFLPKQLRRIREAREEIKIAMENCTSEEKPAYQSKNWCFKIAANIPSGYNGQAIARWGDIAVTILTVGVGRVLIKDVIRYIEKKYASNILDEDREVEDIPKDQFKVCIEVDTDGIYLSQPVDIDDLNQYLTRRIEGMFGIKNEMELELDVYKRGYFIRMKNYILEDLKGNYTIHGASLKSSRMPKCFKKSLHKIAKGVLDGDTNIRAVINDVLDLSQYDLKDFKLKVTLNKNPADYSPTTLYANLAKQASLLNIPVKIGVSLDYFKTVDGYQLARSVHSVSQLDTLYYTKMLGDLIKAFGLEEDLKQKDIQPLQSWY